MSNQQEKSCHFSDCTCACVTQSCTLRFCRIEECVSNQEAQTPMWSIVPLYHSGVQNLYHTGYALCLFRRTRFRYTKAESASMPFHHVSSRRPTRLPLPSLEVIEHRASTVAPYQGFKESVNLGSSQDQFPDSPQDTRDQEDNDNILSSDDWPFNQANFTAKPSYFCTTPHQRQTVKKH